MIAFARRLALLSLALLAPLLLACSDGAPYCTELKPCCEEVGSSDVADTCRNTAANGQDKDCKAALRSLQVVGLCLGGDAGPSADEGPHLTEVCQQLSVCCDGLPDDDQGTCYGALANNDPLACQSTLDGYVSAGSCDAP